MFGRIGIGNYTRTPSTLLVAPTISSCTLVVIDGGFVPCDNSANLLKARYILTIIHRRVELKFD